MWLSILVEPGQRVFILEDEFRWVLMSIDAHDTHDTWITIMVARRYSKNDHHNHWCSLYSKIDHDDHGYSWYSQKAIMTIMKLVLLDNSVITIMVSKHRSCDHGYSWYSTKSITAIMDTLVLVKSIIAIITARWIVWLLSSPYGFYQTLEQEYDVLDILW